MFRNGDANLRPEAAWGQEATIHEKRARPKPSAPVVFASNTCKITWFWPAESTSSNTIEPLHHRNKQCFRSASKTVPHLGFTETTAGTETMGNDRDGDECDELDRDRAHDGDDRDDGDREDRDREDRDRDCDRDCDDHARVLD